MNIVEAPKSIEVSVASGQAKVIYSNRKATHNHKPSKRKKRPKKALKSAKDWNRLYRKAIDAASNNFFADNLINTWYVTLTIKDSHIKEINTVRNWIKEYEKSFSNKVFILANIELDKLHHPHIHLLLTTTKRSQRALITESEVKNWPHGFVKATRPPMKYANKTSKYYHKYIKRIINYSIKTWSNGADITAINKQAINKYALVTTRLKGYIEYLHKKATGPNTNKLRIAYSLYQKANAKYKRELQKQVCVKDQPLYISYGKQKAIRTDNPTDKELDLVKTSFNLKNTQALSLKTVDEATGEIVSEYYQHVEHYSL